MTQGASNRWLHRYAVLTAFFTWVLVWVGGLVTSHEAGLAVPDWPTTYGYNMFFFPVSQWVGGVFYEHTHRLVASAVGMLTIGLAVWLWRKEDRRWLKRLGWIALIAVVAQGVLGGLRVTQLMDELGIVHAAIAQLFLACVSAIALFTSPRWRSLQPISLQGSRTLFRLYLGVTTIVFVQLVIGATMRHEHAGLAIPDFPLAYGKLWPDIDPASIDLYNRMRMEVISYHPITAFQVVLQMVHRFVALAILVGVIWAWRATRRIAGRGVTASRLSAGWMGLVLLQVLLGAATIWTNKAAEIATAHVAVGAATLVLGVLLCIYARGAWHDPAWAPAPVTSGQSTQSRTMPPQPA